LTTVFRLVWRMRFSAENVFAILVQFTEYPILRPKFNVGGRPERGWAVERRQSLLLHRLVASMSWTWRGVLTDPNGRPGLPNGNASFHERR
jgi:hypothetical protein